MVKSCHCPENHPTTNLNVWLRKNAQRLISAMILVIPVKTSEIFKIHKRSNDEFLNYHVWLLDQMVLVAKVCVINCLSTI